MALALKGKLTNPMGQPIRNAQIEMRAMKTSAVVVATATAVAVTSDTGEYTISVEPGTYVIRVMFSGSHSFSTLAKNVKVDATTLATNLNELILSAETQSSDGEASSEVVMTLRALKESVSKSLTEMNQQLADLEDTRTSAKTALSQAQKNTSNLELLASDMRKTLDDASKAATEAAQQSKAATEKVDSLSSGIEDVRKISQSVDAANRSVADNANAAKDSANVASTSATAAHQSLDKAALYANAPEDQVVEDGKYSALHWSEKARKYASGGGAGSSNFDYMGRWDFADNAFPKGNETRNCFWQVSRNVTVDGTDYQSGDLLYHVVDNGIGRFFRNSSSGSSSGSGTTASGAVKSVAGRTGDIILAPADVGLSKLRNLDTMSKEESLAAFASKEEIDALSVKVANSVLHEELAKLTDSLAGVAYSGAITSTTGYLPWGRLSDVPEWIRQTHTDGDEIYIRSPDGTQFRVGKGQLDVFNNKGETTFTIGSNGQLITGTVPESLITGVLPVSKGGTGSGDGKLVVNRMTIKSKDAGLFFDDVGDYGLYPTHDDTSGAVVGMALGCTDSSLAVSNKGELTFTGSSGEVVFAVNSLGEITKGVVPYAVTKGCAAGGFSKRLNDGGIMYVSGNGYMTLEYSNITVNKAKPTTIKFAQPFHDTEYTVQVTKKFGTNAPDAGEFAAQVLPYKLEKDSITIATDYADDLVVCISLSGEKGVVGQDGTTAENSTLPKA